MPPAPGTTVRAPSSSTSQPASPPSDADSHAFKSVPLNRTIASDGAWPSSAATTGGTGSQTSLFSACCQGSSPASGLLACSASVAVVQEDATTKAKRHKYRERFLINYLTSCPGGMVEIGRASCRERV